MNIVILPEYVFSVSGNQGFKDLELKIMFLYHV